MQKLYNNLLKDFTIRLDCPCGHHLEVHWQSQNIPDSVFEIGQNQRKKSKKNKQEDILAKSHFAGC